MAGVVGYFPSLTGGCGRDCRGPDAGAMGGWAWGFVRLIGWWMVHGIKYYLE